MKERYSVDFESVKYDSYDAMYVALLHGEVDTIFPAYGSYWIFEENNLMVTGALTSSYLMMVYQDVYDETTPSVIAILENSPMQQFYAKEHFSESKTIPCGSMEECLKAVLSGEATCTLMCSDTYYAYRNDFEEMSRLNISNTGYEVPVSFATRRDDVQMYTFMKKGLASITDTDIHEALIAGKYANPEMNARQFLQKNVYLVIIVFATVITLMLAFFIYYIISSRRALKLSKHNCELNEKAYIDLATGLPNKNKCEEMLSLICYTRQTLKCMKIRSESKRVLQKSANMDSRGKNHAGK